MPSTLSFQDMTVHSPGFGAMSLSHAYGPANDAESLQVLAKAVNLGCTFWDTAHVYGMGHNEELLGQFFMENPGTREKVFVGSKCGFDVDFEKKTNNGVTNSPSHIRAAIEGTIKRLGSPPDLYYLHRIDPNTPLEESIAALDGIKKAGKCRYIGLSEPSANTLRKACAIAHIDALQIEYSPWFIDHERDSLISTARDLNVTIVAYSPLGRGVLTGTVKDSSQFASDIRGRAPRYTEHWEANRKLIEEVEKLAKKKGCTPGQLSIAWVTAQGAIPIPGTKTLSRLEENWGASRVKLSDEELKEIREVILEAEPKGNRYGEQQLKQVGR